MGKTKLFFLILFITLLSRSGASAQINRYMVFFTDKNGSQYNPGNPEAFLSKRAIERRARYNIDVTLNDLPVNKLYVDLVESINNVSVFHHTKWFNGVLVEADELQIPIIENLAFVKEVNYVAPGSRLKVNATDLSENFTGAQSSGRKSELTNALQNNMLGIDEMHSAGYTGAGKMIAVFDAGFLGMNFSSYFTRLYENGRVVATWDFVENISDVYSYDDHGTSVLSTISGYEEDVFVGTAPDSDVIMCITEDTETEYVIEEYNWLFAAEYSDSIGVDIINTSLGYNTFSDPSMDYSYEDMDGNIAIITRAVDLAASKGILCVVSVGNEGGKDWQKMVAPADADSVLSVGAVNENQEYVLFSSSGPTADDRIKPEVSALGEWTIIVSWDGTLTTAGVWQAYPDLNNMEIIELIKKGSTQYNNPDTLLGYGIPNFKTIQSEITSLDNNLSDSGYKIYPNPVKDRRLFVEVTNAQISGKYINIEIFDVKGSIVFAYRTKIRKDRYELDLKHLLTGIYIIHIYVDKLNGGKAKILIP
jgi:hypothetical protein